jgi:YesN/AraC family two-component response regulator
MHIANIIERECGYQVITANNGVEALEICSGSAPAALLTDIYMPEMDGLQLVEEVKNRFPHVPVVLMTSQGNEELAMSALRSGAASYVPKRHLERDVAETLSNVLTASRADRRKKGLLARLNERTSHFELENDPADVSPLVALLQGEMTAMGLCSPTSRIRVGVALEEAVLNGLIHGNLEVSSELRESADDRYQRQIDVRRHQSPYKERRLHVSSRLTRSKAVFSIRDEGPGFDIAKLPDPTDPANLERPSGRGILLIRTFMDEVCYNKKGNELWMTKLADE